MMRIAAIIVMSLGLASPATSQTIIIGSKPFTESYVLAEIFAQLIENQTDYDVERRFGLQGTFTSFTAISEGSIHLYPEYTGTGLLAILKTSDPADDNIDSLRSKFGRQYGLTWLEPLGFNNTWAIVVKAEFAKKHQLSSISQLALLPDLRAAFTHEFMQRIDGYPGLKDAYNLNFSDVRGIQHILAYEAINGGEIDVMDAYSTDGEIARYNLVVLEDDRRFFPEYLAAPLIRLDLLEKHPELVKVLNRFAGDISDNQMQTLNHDAALAGKDYPAVVAEFISRRMGTNRESSAATPPIVRQTLRHLMLMTVSVIMAVTLALPLGIYFAHRPRGVAVILTIAGIVQTIPSMAMLGFMIPLLGIGVAPAIAALFIYSLLPILRNTITGINGVPSFLLEVADGLGMDRSKRMLWLELPLAAPTLFAGIRTAAVISVGTATLAAFIGAGGLGEPIVQGLSFNDPRMILSGAIPAAALAVLTDGLLGLIERRWSVPKG